MGVVLKTDKLTKVYSGTKVVDEVSITVNEGDVYGFVGKNGAGKTTFIRAVLGLAIPSGGSVSFFDGETLKAAGKRIGSLIEAPSLYLNMTARQNLDLFCTMMGQDKKQVDDILGLTGLADTGRKKAKHFSLGMKQRLGIGMAMIGDPDLLILDEPINGLDPTGIVEIRELILGLKSRGKTVFVSSHFLGELEKIATRYGIISSGKLIEELSAKELTEKCGCRIAVRTDDPEKTADILRSSLGEGRISVQDGVVMIKDNVDDIGRLTNELFQAGVAVRGISEDDNSAEEYFIKRMEEG